MPFRSNPRSYARVAILVGAMAFCAGDSVTQAEPSPLRVTLAPYDAPVEMPSSRSFTAPFGMIQPALDAAPAKAMTTKWQSLQSVVAIETRVMALCRAQREACTPSAARFLDIVDEARSETGRARAGIVNRAVNLAIRPARDNALFGVPDVWQSPLMTFASGSGDCEDYAIAKYVALREAGMSASDLKLVLVRNEAAGEDHAVTAARIDGEWLILDNRKMLLLTDAQASDLKPLIALGEDVPVPVIVRDAGLTLLPATNG